MERVRFRGGWDYGVNGTFVVTLQFYNVATEEDRDLILHRVRGFDGAAAGRGR